jgi:hypothetical protein
MRDKFIVKDSLKNTTVKYPSLRHIARAYPQAGYHQLYQVYLQTTEQTTRKQQKNNDIHKLCQFLKIIDNDPFYDNSFDLIDINESIENTVQLIDVDTEESNKITLSEADP